MAGEDCQADDFDFRDSEDDDVEEGRVLSVHGSAVSETAEAPSVHASPAATESRHSPVINITSSPIVALDEKEKERVDEEQEHFPLPKT